MKKVLLGFPARKKLKEGVDLCANVVKVSLGGNGRNVAIFDGYQTEVINDGVSIAREVKVKDESLMAGVQLAKQCAETTNRDCGDGTTTTIVLLQAVLNQVISELQALKPRVLRETLFQEAKKVIDAIKPQEVKTKEDIYNLALTSSLDPEASKILSDIFWKLGKDAKVNIQEADRLGLESETVEGYQFESSYRSVLGALKEGEKKVLEDIPVLYLDKVDNLDKVQEKLSKEQNVNLVVIANQFERAALVALEAPSLKIYPIQNEEINSKEDIAAFVGERAKRVIIEKDKTTIIGGTGDVQAHVESLKERIAESSQYEKELLEKRIASLTSGIALIKVGKPTLVETNEAVLKIEDAVNAVKSAMEEGYVRGGGMALYEASQATDNPMMQAICKAPREQLKENGSEKVEEGVIDSFRSVRKSFQNALSTGCSILMTEAALIEEKEDED